MAQKIRIELNSDGIRELLCSQPIADVCEQAAEDIAARAGEGFEVGELRVNDFGGGRVGYTVKTATYEARLAEAVDKALSKAVR